MTLVRYPVGVVFCQSASRLVFDWCQPANGAPSKKLQNSINTCIAPSASAAAAGADAADDDGDATAARSAVRLSLSTR